MTDDLLELIARARQRDPEAAVALAHLVEVAVATPDQRVSAAFRLKRRGGDPRTEQRRQRDKAICALARLAAKVTRSNSRRAISLSGSTDTARWRSRRSPNAA